MEETSLRQESEVLLFFTGGRIINCDNLMERLRLSEHSSGYLRDRKRVYALANDVVLQSLTHSQAPVLCSEK